MSRVFVRTILGASIAIGILVAASPSNATVWKNYEDETKCMGASGGNMTNGTNLIVWDCDSHPDQSWTEAGVGGSYVQLEDNKNLSKCAGVSGGSVEELTPLIIWSCNGADDQAWEPVFDWQDGNGHNCYHFVNYNVELRTEQTYVLNPDYWVTDGTKIILERFYQWYNGEIAPFQYWCAY